MRLQWMLGAALLLATLAASGQSLAAGTESGRLAALTARQDLCDLICYAKADGHISQTERALIIREAKSVLSHDEYQSFKRTLDRIAPPPKVAAKRKHLAKMTQKPTQKAIQTATQKPAQKATQRKPAPAERGPELVIPASAVLPDGVAPPVYLR
jgi:hypothetical protein